MTEELLGLVTAEAEATPVPLMAVKVEGNIVGRGAKVKIIQRFKNKEDKAVEAVYKFPLPEESAVCGFKAIIGEKLIEGDIEDRDKAFELYDKALSEGHGAILLDEERPNIFTLSVGNLNPGATAIIEIEYVTLLETTGSGEDTEQAPQSPVVFTGDVVSILARITDDRGFQEEVILSGKVGDADKRFMLKMQAICGESMPIPVLWARERIRDLEEGATGISDMGLKQTHRKENKVREKIIEISKEFGLISRETSFIAIEKRGEKDKTTGEVVLRKVPVNLTKGWHGIGAMHFQSTLSGSSLYIASCAIFM